MITLPRLARLLAHRKQALDRALGELQRAEREAREAEQRLLSCDAALQQARAGQRALLTQTGSAGDFIQAQAWAARCEQESRAARRDLSIAQASCGSQRRMAQAARGELKKLEILEERVRARARASAERRERREEDEWASRKQRARNR